MGKGKPRHDTPISDLDQQAQMNAETRQVTIEARQAAADLRSCMREFEDLIVQRSEDIYHREVKRQMAELARIMTREVDTSSRAAVRRFRDGLDELLRLLGSINGFLSDRVDSVEAKIQREHLNGVVGLLSTSVETTEVAMMNRAPLRASFRSYGSHSHLDGEQQ